MLPGKVIGRVVATKKVESLRGIKLILLQTSDWDGKEDNDYIVAADAVSAGYDEFVFYVESRDASVAFGDIPPIDATIVGIIDGVNMPKEEEK